MSVSLSPRPPTHPESDSSLFSMYMELYFIIRLVLFPLNAGRTIHPGPLAKNWEAFLNNSSSFLSKIGSQSTNTGVKNYLHKLSQIVNSGSSTVVRPRCSFFYFPKFVTSRYITSIIEKVKLTNKLYSGIAFLGRLYYTQSRTQ